MEYFLASVIGAVIGYFTNWLAIKMLFRPYKEKVLLGIKMPFTPGLIPKERERMAKSIADTVGTHLITKEDVTEALASTEMKSKVREWIEAKFLEFKSEDKTVKETIMSLSGQNYEKINNRVKKYIAVSALKGIKNQLLDQNTEAVVKNMIIKELSISPEELLSKPWFQGMKNDFKQKAMAYKDSDDFKEKLEAYIAEQLDELKSSDKTVGEVVPAELTKTIQTYVYNSREDICLNLEEMLGQPETEVKLKNILSSMIGSNMNPLVSMFLNIDSIYEKLKAGLESFLKEDENQKDIAAAINSYLDKLTKSNVKEVIEKLDEGGNANTKQIADFIVDIIIKDKLLDKMIDETDRFVKNFSTVHELISSVKCDYIEIVTAFAITKVKNLIENRDFDIVVKNMTEQFVEDALNIKFSTIINANEQEVKDNAVEIAQTIYQKFIINEGQNILENIDIRGIVEEKINSFDVQFAEKLIVDIAQKELNAITWLGALLGAIIGVFSPILGSL